MPASAILEIENANPASNCVMFPSKKESIPLNTTAKGHGRILTSHCVKFVASPGKTEKLCMALHEVVTPMLAEEHGFEGMIVMVSRREPRLVTAFSFARKNSKAANSSWEDVPAIKRFLGRFVDRCAGADSLEATLPPTALPGWIESNGVAVVHGN